MSLARPGGALSSLHTQVAAMSRIQVCAPPQRGWQLSAKESPWWTGRGVHTHLTLQTYPKLWASAMGVVRLAFRPCGGHRKRSLWARTVKATPSG